MIQSLFNKFQPYKSSANLFLPMQPPPVESRAGSLWLWWLSPPASRMLKICWTRVPVRGKPFSFRISSQIREVGASWGVMGCHIVSGSSNLVLRLVSLCFIQELNCMWVYIRLFSNVWGTCFEAKTEVFQPAICNMAGCLQHGRLLATCHAMAFSVSAESAESWISSSDFASRRSNSISRGDECTTDLCIYRGW